jgi:hypothetical protein
MVADGGPDAPKKDRTIRHAGVYGIPLDVLGDAYVKRVTVHERMSGRGPLEPTHSDPSP